VFCADVLNEERLERKLKVLFAELTLQIPRRKSRAQKVAL
jgi:hypothetical protein